jgi:hypothetical protein
MQFRSAMLAGAVFLLPGVSAACWGQPPDRIFVGESLGLLREAIATEYVELEKATLRAEILRNQVSALFIPGQATAPPTVRKCYRRTTTFHNDQVKRSDLDRLHRFAEDDIPQAIVSVFESMGETDKVERALAHLRQEVEQLASQPETRQAAIRFSGALLAELGSREPMADFFVRNYKEHREAEARDAIADPAAANALRSGLPYVLGYDAVSPADLAAVRAGDIETMKVNGEEYKKLWVGKSLIVLPPNSEMDDLPNKTGVELFPRWRGALPGGGDLRLPNRGGAIP